MRRKILLPAFFYASGIVLYFNERENFNCFIALFSLSVIIFSLYFLGKYYDFSKKQVCILAVCIALGVGNSWVFQYIGETPLEKYIDETHEYIVKVVKTESKSGYISIMGKILMIDSYDFSPRNIIHIKCYQSTDSASNLLGNILSIKGEITLPKSNSNPHCFNYRTYLKSKGVFYELSCNSYVVKKETNDFKKTLIKEKENFLNKLSKKVKGDNLALVQGICFGEKNEIDDDSMRWFRENGTAHVLAVSGLHIGLIYSCLKKLFYKKHKALFYFSVIIILAMYGMLTQWSVSVVRATFLIVTCMMAFVLEKRFDLTSGVVFVGLVMLIYNPFQIFNVGFQMSFMAVCSLSFFSRWVEKCINKLFEQVDFRCKESLIKSLVTVFSIQLGLGFFMANTFNYFSIISFLVNIPTVLFVSLLVPIILICFLAFMLSGNIYCDILTSKVCDVITLINKIAWNEGEFSLNTPSISKVIEGAIIILLFYLASEGLKVDVIRKNYKKISVTILIIILSSTCLFVDGDSRFNQANLIFVDVGQGDCLHIRNEGKDYLIDGGGKIDYCIGEKVLKPYLLKNGGTEIEMAVATHNHTDHYLGLEQLSHQIPIKNIVVSSGYISLKENIERNFDSKEYHYVNKENVIKISDDFIIKILWPSSKARLEDADDENQVSLVFMMVYRGIRILITGDIDSNCEDELIKMYKGSGALKCDILKVAHHGSKYSSSAEFIDETSPDIAVISVGKNNYGHPDNSVIERLKARGSLVYRTDLDGAIGFKVTEKGIAKIFTMH